MRIILADEQKLLLEGLVELFRLFTGYEVVATFDNGQNLKNQVGRLKPDIILLDTILKKMNGIEAAKAILKEYSNIKIIALTMNNDHRSVATAFQSGMHGYLMKTCPFEEVQKAIQVVISNHTYLTPIIMDVVIEDFTNQIGEKDLLPYGELSNRERQVMQLFAEGQSTRQIASELNISNKTVATHRSKIYKKLNMDNMVQLTRFAIREGITHT